MAEVKVVIADVKTGKCYQKVLAEDQGSFLIGKKIGDKLTGDSFDMAGYEMEITGGADYCGFPMRRDIDGPVRKQILLVSGVGIGKVQKGIRKRKTVCGNTIHENITQVCAKITKYGKKPLEEPAAEAAKEGSETPAAEKKPKEDKPAKAPKKEKTAEAPKEATKEEPKEALKEAAPEAKEEKPKAKKGK